MNTKLKAIIAMLIIISLILPSIPFNVLALNISDEERQNLVEIELRRALEVNVEEGFAEIIYENGIVFAEAEGLMCDVVENYNYGKGEVGPLYYLYTPGIEMYFTTNPDEDYTSYYTIDGVKNIVENDEYFMTNLMTVGELQEGDTPYNIEFSFEKNDVQTNDIEVKFDTDTISGNTATYDVNGKRITAMVIGATVENGSVLIDKNRLSSVVFKLDNKYDKKTMSVVIRGANDYCETLNVNENNETTLEGVTLPDGAVTLSIESAGEPTPDEPDPEPEAGKVFITPKFIDGENALIIYGDKDGGEHELDYSKNEQKIEMDSKLLTLQIAQGELESIDVKIYDENMNLLTGDSGDIYVLTDYGSGNEFDDWMEQLIAGDTATLDLTQLDEKYTFEFEINVQQSTEQPVSRQTFTWSNVANSEWNNGKIINGGTAKLVKAYDANDNEIWNIDNNYSDTSYTIGKNEEKFVYEEIFTVEQNENGGEIEAAEGVQLVFEIIPEYGKQLVNITLGENAGTAQNDKNNYKVVMPAENASLNTQFNNVDNKKINKDTSSFTNLTYTLDKNSFDSGTAVLTLDKANNLSNAQKQGFADAAGEEYEVSKYFNVSLQKVLFKGKNVAFNENSGYLLDDIWNEEIYNLGDKKAKVTVTLDAETKPEDIIVLHELHNESGNPTGYELSSIVDKKQDSNGIWTVTFEISEFSNFAIASKIEETIETFEVSFNTNGGTSIETQEVESGNNATKPKDPTKEGWEFVGWYADDTFAVEFNFSTPITQDTIVYAKWKEVIVHNIVKVEAKAATCEEDGNKEYYRCTDCDEYYEDAEGTKIIEDKSSVIIPASHKIEKVEAKAATCEEDGNTEYYRCTVCNKYFRDARGNSEISDKTSVIIRGEHDLTKHDAKVPTCEEDGNIEYYSCSKCGKYYLDEKGKTEIVDKTSVIIPGKHELTKTEAKTATCEEDGNIAYYSCSKCGKYYQDAEGKTEITDKTSVVIKATHKLQKVEAKTATCEEDGNKEYYRCTVCDKYYEDLEGKTEITDKASVIIKASHKIEKVEARAATCEEDGNKEYYRCTVCDKYYEDLDGKTEITDKASVIIKASHKIEKVEAKTATCEEDGNKEYYRCTVCDKYYEDLDGKTEITDKASVIIKASHKLEKVEAKAATCKETGNVEYYKCTVCNKKYSDKEGKNEISDVTIPINNDAHDWDEGTVTTPATCTTDGIRTFTCKHDSTHKKTETIPAKHDWGEWVVTKEATVDEEGSKTRTCKIDSSHTETEVIPRLPYTIVEGDNQIIKAEEGSDLVIKANGSVDKFVELLLDGKKVDSSDYTIESGSTIITLASSLLDTLSTGNHTLTFVYTDGEVSTNFRVARNETPIEDDELTEENEKLESSEINNTSNPKTGDKIYTYVILFVVSTIGLICTKKKKNNTKIRKH